MKQRLAILLLAVVALTSLAGCSDIPGLGLEALRGPRTWTYSAGLTSGKTFTVAVTDRTGRIDEVEVDPPGVNPVDDVTNPDGEPNVALVSWIGGACDERTTVFIDNATAAGGLVARFMTEEAPGDCDAIGLGHVLRLVSGAPLPAADVEVRLER